MTVLTGIMAPKILLIDDEPLMHLLYKGHIEKAGYILLTAKNAEEGLAIVKAEKPVLVVIDIIMTGKDGLAALRDLKSSNETSKIPVIVSTGSITDAHHATRKEAATAGAAVFLTKPISPAQLLNEIKRLAPTTVA